MTASSGAVRLDWHAGHWRDRPAGGLMRCRLSAQVSQNTWLRPLDEGISQGWKEDARLQVVTTARISRIRRQRRLLQRKLKPSMIVN